MEFINKLEDENYVLEKFHIFIKNIGPDGRSKIDQYYKDTKIRLFNFFNEVYNTLTNDYHQINIEKYMLANSKDKELQKFKRKI